VRKEQTIQIQNAKTDYTERNKSASPVYHEREEIATAGTFTRRIGNTVYRVGVHYSTTSKETMNEKISRLVRSEVMGE